MILRTLGKTGLSVSPIGYGAFKIGRNEGTKYPAAYDLPDDARVEHLLNAVLDLGVCHIDTAPAYGTSEERIGRFLARRRNEYVLSTKAGEVFENGQSRYDFSARGIRKSIARSLDRLRTDVLDIVLLHAPADDLAVLCDTAAVETLRKIKQSGDVRAIGLSAKTIAAARQSLAWADVLMVEYSPLETAFVPLIAEAAAQRIGVIVKKGLGSGRLPARTAIPFVLETAGVTNLVTGGLDLGHLRENVEMAQACRLQAAPGDVR